MLADMGGDRLLPEQDIFFLNPELHPKGLQHISIRYERPRLYVVGSLRNLDVPYVAQRLRENGYETFDDWFAAGPEADDKWQAYEQKERDHSYREALQGYAAKHVYHYDLDHLNEADAVVLVMPAGKSAFLELGYGIGAGKKGYILMQEEPERWDVMFQFATVVEDVQELLAALDNDYPTEKVYFFFRDLQKKVYQTTVDHGFDAKDPDAKTISQQLLLAVGELAEAQEEIRAGKDPSIVYSEDPYPYSAPKVLKPEGFGIELADAVIRIMNLASSLDIDLETMIVTKDAYNQTRPYMHGKKF